MTEKPIFELIRRTTSTLAPDVRAALSRAVRREARGTSARAVLETILRNADLAERNATPMCQDTGTLAFFVDEALRRRITPAVIARGVARATAAGLLRRNTIDAVTGVSADDNVAVGAPSIHYVAPGTVCPPGSVALLMKGGGSENMSRQFSLPDAALGAGRDLEGVRRCVLSAVRQAQGFGCAPGILGVCIGGDRAAAFAAAKEQLFRPLDDTNPDPALARLEKRLLREANALGIGPMGLGGRTTLLGVKVCGRSRVPASFFVTVAYCCWACRRGSIRITAK